jgi:hypothetical protein
MPNSETFSMVRVKALLDSEVAADGTGGRVPFARNTGVAEITNDLNPKTKALYHMDAVDFLRMFPDNSAEGVLYDPPYSSRQVKECYDGIGVKYTYEESINQKIKDSKNEIARVVKPGGKVISFGWNSGGIGESRGFRKLKILLVFHGGAHNDTICVVERKIEAKPLLEGLD